MGRRLGRWACLGTWRRGKKRRNNEKEAARCEVKRWVKDG